MERLTAPYEYGDGYRSKCAETCGECDGCWGLDEIVNRLGAYEDTGLTPEEVKELAHDTTGPLHRKISEWIDAEAAGRIVVLPEGGESDG